MSDNTSTEDECHTCSTTIRLLKSDLLLESMLVDSVERLPKGEIDAFANHFLTTIQSVLQKVNLRVRLAGRYIGSVWKKRSREFEFAVRPLTPFRFRYVKDTVQPLLPHQQNLDLYAAHLMQVTGGHPGCMAKILECVDCTQPVEENFQAHQNSYQEIVLSVAHEIRKSILEPLRNTFDVLSVFRRYNYRLLHKIIEAGLIEYGGGADSLEKALTATYLVRRKAGFIQDEIVRRLLAIRLRWEEPERFIELCNQAIQIYEQDLQRTISRPEIIAIEGLYQELQLGYYQGEQTPASREALRDTFFADNGILRRYLRTLAAKPDALDTSADLKTLLKDENGDWEFQFAVNFFLRRDQYDNEPYEETVAQVEDFFAHVL